MQIIYFGGLGISEEVSPSTSVKDDIAKNPLEQTLTDAYCDLMVVDLFSML